MKVVKSSARIRVEASAEEVDGIDDDVNNLTSSSWMFFVENSAASVSVLWEVQKCVNLLTSLSFSNDDSATLKDLLELVHLQVLVGISGLGTRGDQRFLHRELDYERLQIINPPLY